MSRWLSCQRCLTFLSRMEVMHQTLIRSGSIASYCRCAQLILLGWAVQRNMQKLNHSMAFQSDKQVCLACLTVNIKPARVYAVEPATAHSFPHWYKQFDNLCIRVCPLLLWCFIEKTEQTSTHTRLYPLKNKSGRMEMCTSPKSSRVYSEHRGPLCDLHKKCCCGQRSVTVITVRYTAP